MLKVNRDFRIYKIIVIILFIPLAIFAFVFLVLVRNTFILSRYPNLGLPSQYSMPYQEVEFKSTDDVSLKGWLIINPEKSAPKPLIIFCHGFGANKSDLLDIASFIYSAGYNIFMFDFRAHGDSTGYTTTFGYWEQRDLEGAIKYLKERKDLNIVSLGIYGLSAGGSTAIMVAAGNQDIKALVLDSPYVDLEETLAFHTKLLTNLPLGKIAVLCYRLRFWVNTKKISPLREIHKISPRAVFIINGENDDRMKVADAMRLFENAKEPKKLWIVEGAEHSGSYWKDKGQYQNRVIKFLNEHLK